MFWVGSAILFLGLTLKLLAANPKNEFVIFIYGISQKTVGIFSNIVGDIELTSVVPKYVVELSTIIAWLVFWILYSIAKKILTIVTTPK